MKKYILVLALVFIPFITNADTLLGFADGSLYNPNGTLQYICFLDGSCLDKDNNQTTRQALGLAPVPQTVSTFPASTPQTVYVPVYLPTPLVNSPDLVSGESQIKTIDFSQELRWCGGTTSYIECDFTTTNHIGSSTSTLTINNQILNGRLGGSNSKVPFIVFSGNFQGGQTYNYQLNISGTSYQGTYSGTVTIPLLNGLSQCQNDINNFKQQILDIQSKLSSDQQALQGQGRGIPLSIIQAQQAQLATTASQQIQDIEEQIAQENCSN